MKSYKIYKYTNLITGMSYIGQTCRSLKRRADRDMKGYGGCEKFWEAIQHYGTGCWRVEILWDGLTLEEANIYEQVEIRDNETLYPYGYNLSEGGSGIKGYKWTDEQKKRQSTRFSGENHPMYGKPAHNKGVPQSEESRKKQSESMKGKTPWNKGKKMSAEYCRIVSESKKGQVPWNKGKKMSPEYCRRNSESHKGQVAWNKGLKTPPEICKKQSESHKGQVAWNKGKKMSAEYCRIVSESKKRREYYPAQSFFISLSAELPIKEKRKQLYIKYPNVPKGTIMRWVSQWKEKCI